MVSVCLPSDALSQHLLSYLGFSYIGHGVSLHGCSSKVQPKNVQMPNAKECSNYHTIALISHTSKVLLKILQARIQQYMNHELPDVQAGFRKGRGLFYTSVSLLLSRTQGYCYHLSKFHIYALVYCIGVFLSGLLHSV